MRPLGLESFGSRARAYQVGVWRAFSAPAVILGSSYLGFGALVRESELPLWLGLFSTATGWALPGQVVLVELLAVGASLLSIAFVVALTNARLLPMAVALMPSLRAPSTPTWQYYTAAHWVAVTGWAEAMRRNPYLPPSERLPYFVGFASTLWVITLCATALGFFLAGRVPDAVTLGLVFLNPIYFMLVFAADVRQRGRIMALGIGACIGPPLHWLTPDWGLLLAGLIGGSLAFGLDRVLAGRP